MAELLREAEGVPQCAVCKRNRENLDIIQSEIEDLGTRGTGGVSPRVQRPKN